MRIEDAIGRAVMGEDSPELGIARVSVHAAVTSALFCRMCGGILDNSTAQVVETGEGSVTPLCGDHHVPREHLQKIANQFGTTVEAHTWNGTDKIDPAE